MWHRSIKLKIKCLRVLKTLWCYLAKTILVLNFFSKIYFLNSWRILLKEICWLRNLFGIYSKFKYDTVCLSYIEKVLRENNWFWLLQSGCLFKSIILFSSSNTQFYEFQIFVCLLFEYFVPDKGFESYQNEPKNANLILYIKKENPFATP